MVRFQRLTRARAYMGRRRGPRAGEQEGSDGHVRAGGIEDAG